MSTVVKKRKKEEVASKHADLEKVKEALEKDPGEVFNRALDLLRKESPEDFELRHLLLKRTYEKVIKKTVSNPEVLNMVGERLLGLMRELGVPP